MIQYIIIEHMDENHSPPSNDVLKVALVGDRIFLDIGEHSESSDTVGFRTKHHFDVSAADLGWAVNALLKTQAAN